MDEFEPMRDFYQPRQAITFDRLALGLRIQIEDSRVVLDNFFFPGLTFTANILRDGQHAGTVRYGQSPLQDRLYICDFKVRPELRKMGVGQGALWQLWCLYQVPLTPMNEVGTSTGFWAKVRSRFAGAGVELTEDLRSTHQGPEMARWQHLVPEPEHERRIRELKASPEWPAIKARLEAEYGPCPD